MEISFHLNGNMTDLKTQLSPEESSGSFHLQTSRLTYYQFRSTDKRIQTTSFNINPSIQSHKNTSNSNTSKSSYLDVGASIYHNDRFYRNNKWFFEIENNLITRFNGNRVKSNAVKNKTNEAIVNDRLSLGFGKGRIEHVQDAQMALFILNDLNEMGLITGNPEAQTINEFATLITDINNKRVFDSRRRRIYELTRIESFLREKGILSETDIRHFTIINDNWALAMNPFRSSGSNWYVRVVGNGSLDRDRSEYENGYSQINKSYQYSFVLGPQIGYENYLPVNLHWQRNMGISANWNFITTDLETTSIYNGTMTEIITASRESDARVYMFYGMSYYPNNRTSIGGVVALEGKRHQHDDKSAFERSYILSPEFNLYADYFIGYRTRLNASAQVHYDKAMSDFKGGGSLNEHFLNAGFSISLFHAIF